MTKHRHVGTTPIVLASGRPLAPGDTVSGLDTEDPDNRAFVDDGVLAELPAPKQRESRDTTTKEGK